MLILRQSVHKYLRESNKKCNYAGNRSIKNIDGFVNRPFAQQLLADLNQTDDSQRKLNKIDSVSAQQLFTLFGIKDPGCDANSDSTI